MTAPQLQVLDIGLYERPVSLRLPFKFGAATVTQCPQAYVRLELALEGSSAVHRGASAELMVPKWFDKNPQLNHDQNFDQLRLALQLAAQSARQRRPMSAWQLSTLVSDEVQQAAKTHGLPRLAAQFGPAVIDKAVADALLRALNADWVSGLRKGALGDPYSARLALHQPETVFARHTVGMLDRLIDSDTGVDPKDGLPVSLQEAIAAYGLRYFKIKLCGRLEEDLERLQKIAAVVGPLKDYRVTLDGNETFESVGQLGTVWRGLRASQVLKDFMQHVLLLEQPLPRRLALQESLQAAAVDVPVILDESDDHDDVLSQGLALGYRGISSKACKGIYRSLHSAAVLAEKPGAGLLLSGEDLTCQAGLGVQQDTLLAASLGVTHIERNGHHYVDGFGSAPPAEGQAFAHAHAGLYRIDANTGRARLEIQNGQLDLRSLYVAGFAAAASPVWNSLQEMVITKGSLA